MPICVLKDSLVFAFPAFRLLHLAPLQILRKALKYEPSVSQLSERRRSTFLKNNNELP